MNFFSNCFTKINPMPLPEREGHFNKTLMKSNSLFKQKLDDILVEVSWGHLSMRYFGKSPSWLYNKLRGIDGNGKPVSLTDEELAQFKGALCDLADRIRRVADSL